MLDPTTIIILAIAVVSVLAVVAGICVYAERFVAKIAAPAEERSGREMIKEEAQKKLNKMEASAKAYRIRSQEEAWQNVKAFASDLAASAEAAAPSGRAAAALEQAEKIHAAS